METTREAVRSLVQRGQIVVLQRGQQLNPGDPYRGPIRLRLCNLG
jgi:hypothetical protein